MDDDFNNMENGNNSINSIVNLYFYAKKKISWNLSVTESDEAADMGNNIACGEISAETDDPHQAAETVFGININCIWHPNALYSESAFSQTAQYETNTFVETEEDDSFDEEFIQQYNQTNQLMETNVLKEILMNEDLLPDDELEDDCLSDEELYFSESDDDTSADVKTMVLIIRL